MRTAFSGFSIALGKTLPDPLCAHSLYLGKFLDDSSTLSCASSSSRSEASQLTLHAIAAHGVHAGTVTVLQLVVRILQPDYDEGASLSRFASFFLLINLRQTTSNPRKTLPTTVGCATAAYSARISEPCLPYLAILIAPVSPSLVSLASHHFGLLSHRSILSCRNHLYSRKASSRIASVLCIPESVLSPRLIPSRSTALVAASEGKLQRRPRSASKANSQRRSRDGVVDERDVVRLDAISSAFLLAQSTKERTVKKSASSPIETNMVSLTCG